MAWLHSHVENTLAKRSSAGLVRVLSNKEGLTDFCSNDYLGLARSQELASQIRGTYESLDLSNGATGSRLISGNHQITMALEEKLASIFQGKAALIFNSGYSANVGILSSIVGRGDTIIYDELVHASIKDGARLSLANRLSFKHNDISDLEKKIQRAKAKVLIAVESIYSMDGDECPLAEIIAIAEKYGSEIFLDEAHSTGVYGDKGAGLAVVKQLHNRVAIRVHTFGKAMGVHGACAVSSIDTKHFLINFARAFIYTTALSPHSIVSIACSFDFLSKNLHLQHELINKVNLFLREKKPELKTTASSSAIQTVIFSNGDHAKNAATQLAGHGIDVRAILSPTVPQGSERLRICIHTFNTDNEIKALAHRLNDLNDIR